jgi:hypothetical protein
MNLEHPWIAKSHDVLLLAYRDTRFVRYGVHDGELLFKASAVLPWMPLSSEQTERHCWGGGSRVLVLNPERRVLMLLALGAILITIWLYAIRDANPYGGWTHLLLAAGMMAWALHLLHSRKVGSTRPGDTDAATQRHCSSLLSRLYDSGLSPEVLQLMPTYGHPNNAHSWDAEDRCRCGAARCEATQLNVRSNSVRCRSAAQPASPFCKKHSYLNRGRKGVTATPAST